MLRSHLFSEKNCFFKYSACKILFNLSDFFTSLKKQILSPYAHSNLFVSVVTFVRKSATLDEYSRTSLTTKYLLSRHKYLNFTEG